MLHSTSDEASRNASSQNAINQSHYAQRVSPFRSGHLNGIPTLKATLGGISIEAICAVPAPRRLRAAFFAYFFLLMKKSRSPKAEQR
jgi:hypothetical protein